MNITSSVTCVQKTWDGIGNYCFI